jgi:hypothetical protein
LAWVSHGHFPPPTLYLLFGVGLARTTSPPPPPRTYAAPMPSCNAVTESTEAAYRGKGNSSKQVKASPNERERERERGRREILPQRMGGTCPRAV